MSTHNDTHSEAHEHHGSSIYLKTLLVLFILTAITVGASYINFGSGNVAIALFIASIKAIIVALVFMHLKDDKPMYGIIAAAGFVFLGIFLMFDLLDFNARVKYQPFNYSTVSPREKIPERLRQARKATPKRPQKSGRKGRRESFREGGKRSRAGFSLRTASAGLLGARLKPHAG